MITMTELELINELHDRGEKDLSVTNKHFIEKGFLKVSSSSYKTFISKVEQYYSIEKVEGRGIKRTYSLKEKDSIDVRVLNYKGDQPTEEELFVKDYVHHALTGLELQGKLKSRSHGKWLEELNLLNVYGSNLTTNSEDILHNLKHTFFLHTTQKQLNERKILNNFKYSSSEIASRLFKSAIKKLINDGSIVEYIEYKAFDGDYISINQEEYEAYNESLKVYLQSLDISIQHYNMIVTGKINNPTLKESIQLHMRNTTGYNFTYKNYLYELIVPSIKISVDKHEYNSILVSKCLTDIKRKQGKLVNQSDKFGLQTKLPYVCALAILKGLDDKYESEFNDEIELNKQYLPVNESEMTKRILTRVFNPEAIEVIEVEDMFNVEEQLPF